VDALQLGVDQPDSGVLLDRMVRSYGAVLDAGRLIAPRVEAEIAFVLGEPVPAGATRAGGVGEEPRTTALVQYVSAATPACLGV
jgi:2-keto-4-pentenoate hydratase